MFGKIAIRNIPSQILGALEALADVHDRSTEAEARQALRAWVEPSLVQESRNTRRKDVAERLNRMLMQVNFGRHGTKLTTSHLAEAIHEERAEDVEDWFLGEKEPSFSQLSAVAKFLGVDQDWLKHGEKALYPPTYERLPEDPFEAVDWLLSWTPANGISEKQVTRLHLIRADSSAGELYLVKESKDGHFLTFRTPIHVSEEIGNGGEASLAAFCVTLELLYNRYTKSGGGITVLGHLLHTDDIGQLMNGNTHPGSLLEGNSRSMWWEDLWDGKMAPKHNYWPAWKSLHARIESVISARTRLNELRSRIRQGAMTAAHSDL